MLRQPTMTVEVDETERALLCEVLAGVIADLSPEIADTDNPSYRRMLIERRNQLQALLDKFNA